MTIVICLYVPFQMSTSPCHCHRPGEKFKAATKKRRGTDLTMDDVNGAAPAEGEADAADDASGAIMGAGACIKKRIRSCFGESTDVSAPLALRTPREASHLVK